MSKDDKLLRVSDSQKRALAIATIIALAVAVIFLKDYLMLIVVTAIVAFLFDPVYQWFLKRGTKPEKAVVYTFFVSMLSVVIPLILVLLMTTAQVNHLVQSISNGDYSIDPSQMSTDLIDSINRLLTNWGVNYQLNQTEISQNLTAAAQEFGTKLLQSIAGSVAGIFGLITTVIIYIYVFFSMLRNQKTIVDTATALNPLGEKITDVYLQRMGSMTKAMVRGQFIIAVCQGFASALGLAIVGMPELFFFFFVILTIMSFVPLGAGIVTIPIGIVMMLMGNVWQGVFVIANHLIIVTNIDNVLRPRLVPKDARLDPALTMLSVFGGLAVFGFPGIVVGPVLMIIIITTIQMFLEVYRDVNALDQSKSSKPQSIWGFIKGLKPKRT